jgi:rubrerythrin
MNQELTGTEVLEIAEKMEQNAARFYRRAAGMYDDVKISRLFSDLAQWEKRHVEIFSEMKERLSQQSWGLGQYGAERPDASRMRTPTAVFPDGADPSQELTGRETKADVLRMAIQKEKDSIAYYTSLKEFILGDEDVRAIKDILGEEERHVRILTQSLEQIEPRYGGTYG